MTVLNVDIPFVSAIEWSPETRLTTDPKQDVSPSIMQTGVGTIWVVWVSDRMGVGNDELFYKTSSNYGLNWSLDTRFTEALGYDSNPSIMQASDGTIWVVWASDRTGNYDLFYKTSPDNGASWSYDTPLTIDPNRDTSPSIMQATNGTIWVVWSSDRTGNSELFYKTYNGSAWLTERQLTNDPSPDKYPSIMQASNGTIWVVWSSYRTGNYELFYKTFNGPTWSSDTQLTNNQVFDMVPSIAQARDGTIWVVWQSGRPEQALDDLYYKVYDGSAWSSDRQLTSDPASDMTSSIAQINDGKIWIVWAADRDEDFDIYYKTVQVKIPGDVDGDVDVDISDLSDLSNAYGSELEDPNWNPNCDFNSDDKVDVSDLFILSKNFGKS